MSDPRSQALVLRADAAPSMGTGHVMRSLALAQAWQDLGGRAVFASVEMPVALRKRLLAEGCAIQAIAAPDVPEDSARTAALAKEVGAEWVVVDGYHFSDEFEYRLHDVGLRVLAIDDYGHASHRQADLVLNQNLVANACLYPGGNSETRLLLGTQYALLRREFAAFRTWQRSVPDVAHKVLVTLGGTDPDNVTLKVIQAIEMVDMDQLDVVVVVGGGNPHIRELEAAARASAVQIQVRAHVMDMPGLMAWADVAVAAGGITSWERALMGLPSLILVLADNQYAIAAACAAAGLGWNLAWQTEVTAEALADQLARLIRDRKARVEMASSNQRAVDGYGAERVTCELTRQ